MFPDRAQTTVPYRFVALGFGVISLLLFGVVAAVGFSRASLEIHLAPTDVTTAVPVSVAETPTGERSIRGTFFSTTVTGSKTVTATSGVSVPAKATGTITITNSTSAAQPLVAGTRLLSKGGVLFRTTERVTVPANGSVDAAVEADQPGEQGEIAPTTFTLPGLRAANQLLITGQSTTAMTGGTTTTSAVTADDRTAAQAALVTELVAQATANLEDQLTQSALPYTLKIINQTSAPRTSASNTVSVAVTVDAIAYSREELTTLLKNELQAAAASDATVSSVDEEAINFTLQQSDVKAGTAIVEIQGRGRAALTASHEQFQASAFTGKTRAQIDTQLRDAEGVASYTLHLSPFWATKTPNQPGRVHVQIVP